MAITSPDSIYYADGSEPASLSAITAAMATSIQTAFNEREAHNFSWADTTAKSAQTGMSTGDIGYQIDDATFYIYNGASWDIWNRASDTYTPTFTNFTASSSTFTYTVASGIVTVFGKATVTAVTGSMTLTTPSGFSIDTTSLGAVPASQIGYGAMDDASTAIDFPLGVRVASSTSVSLTATNAASTYTTIVATSSTIPLTWASGDTIYVTFSYPVA